MYFDDEKYAERCLQRIGYYRLSAYWYPFRQFCSLPSQPPRYVRCDLFPKGTSFDQALAFYLFDKSVRLTIIDALERIEIGIRSLVVETLGPYGALAYRDPINYTKAMASADSITREVPLHKFLHGLDNAFSYSKEEFAMHFRGTYCGHPPIWIAAGGWDWGNLTYVLRYLSDKNMEIICRKIHPALKRKTLISWMTSLNEVRNACAHHSRLWNKALTNRPSYQSQGNFPEFDHLRNGSGAISEAQSTRLYGALMPTIFLVKRMYPRTRWHLRFAALVTEKPLPKETSITTAGFPLTWASEAIWT